MEKSHYTWIPRQRLCPYLLVSAPARFWKPLAKFKGAAGGVRSEETRRLRLGEGGAPFKMSELQVVSLMHYVGENSYLGVPGTKLTLHAKDSEGLCQRLADTGSAGTRRLGL